MRESSCKATTAVQARDDQNLDQGRESGDGGESYLGGESISVDTDRNGGERNGNVLLQASYPEGVGWLDALSPRPEEE